MHRDKKTRHSAALRQLERFIEQDGLSADALKLEQAIELAMYKLDEMPGACIREATIRRYNAFMKELSDDIALYIKQRMKSAARPILN